MKTHLKHIRKRWSDRDIRWKKRMMRRTYKTSSMMSSILTRDKNT